MKRNSHICLFCILAIARLLLSVPNSCSAQSLAADGVRSPIRILASTAKSCYVVEEPVSIRFSLLAYQRVSMLCYLAFQQPDGSFLFYSGETDSLYDGDPADRSTWTPYYDTPMLLSSGSAVFGLGVYSGGFSTAGSYKVHAVLIQDKTGVYLSNISSDAFRVFNNYLAILDGTIHVGDSYESYMADWEVPTPQGVSIDTEFFLGTVPTGDLMIEGAYSATYYSNNPVYLNGVLLGFIPGLMNVNSWRRFGALMPSGRLRQGINTLTFKSSLNSLGHYDNYMVKEVGLFYD